MAEIKGALIICDRCHISAFAELGDYDSIEIPYNWEIVHFGSCLESFNLCPSCYEEFESAKVIFFSDVAKTNGGVISWGAKDGK